MPDFVTKRTSFAVASWWVVVQETRRSSGGAASIPSSVWRRRRRSELAEFGRAPPVARTANWSPTE
ncbi:hypothetical protein U1Q18_014917, partial [Sarracenia purpurea var. burkii]